MSVINKALSELDKRNNSTAYGKYVPAESKGNGLRLALIAILAVAILAVVVAAVYRFGGTDKALDEDKTALTAAVSNNEAVVGDVTNQVAANKDDNSQLGVGTGQVIAQASEQKNETPQAHEDKQTAEPLQVDIKTSNVNEKSALAKVEDSHSNKDSNVSLAIAKDNNQAVVEKPLNNSKKDNESNVNSVVYSDEDDGGIDAYGEVAQEEAWQRKAENKPNSFIKVSKKKMTVDEQVVFYRKNAERAVAHGDTVGAIDSYKNILAVKSNDIKARERLAGLLFGSGNSLEAVKVLDQGIRQNPGHYDYRLYLSRIYAGSGRTDEAIRVLNQAVPPVSGNVDYYATLASLARDSGDYSSAEQAYRRLATSGGRDGKWYLGLAIVEEKQGKNVEALKSYRQAGQLYLSKGSRDFVQKRIMVLEAAHHDR